jgi:hypothetical protein
MSGGKASGNQAVQYTLVDDLPGARRRISSPSFCNPTFVGLPKLGEEMGNNLLQALFAGDVAKVATLLAAQDLQSFLNYQNKDGFTALHAATANDDLDVTRLLIEAGCNVNVTSVLGRTPLMTVAQSDIQLDGLHVWRIVPDLANMFLSSYPDMQYCETYCTNLIDQQNKKVKALSLVYDNACNSVCFIMNRDPSFFKRWSVNCDDFIMNRDPSFFKKWSVNCDDFHHGGG